MKKIFENKPRFVFWAGFAVVLLLTITGSLFYGLKSKDNNEIMAIVGSEKITKTDFKEGLYGINFEGSPNSPDPEGRITKEERENLFRKLIERRIIDQKITEEEKAYTEEEYRAEGIQRLGEDVFNAYREGIGFTEKQKELIKKNIEYGIWEKRIEKRVVGWAEGDLIIARFDKYSGEPPQEFTEADKAKWRAEREANYQSDKEYATTKINELHTRLTNKEITPEQAIEITLNDNRLNQTHFYPWVAALSTSFSKEEYIQANQILGLSKIREAILASTNGVNVPRIIMGESEDGSEKEVLWLIVNLEEKGGGGFENYQEWIESFYKKEGFIRITDNEFSGITTATNTRGVAYAHAGPHPCTLLNHRGVNTGNINSTAGLIINTNHFNASGAGPNPVNVNVTVTGRSGTTNKVRYTPEGTNQSGANSETFGTGGTWWVDENTPCATPGVAVLGYGSISKRNFNGHFGNRYSLACQGSPFTVTATNLTGRPTGSRWINPSQSVAVVNGATSTVTFTWRDNRAPVPTVENPGNLNIPAGANDIAVAFVGNSTDPDIESGKVQIMYRRVGSATWTSFGSSNGAEDPAGNRTAVANGVTVPNINQWGWSWNQNPARADGWANNGARIHYPAIRLAAGTYEIAARGVDRRGLYSLSWDRETFTINPAHTITYVGNGHTGGNPPPGTPASVVNGGTHTVLGNTGNFVRSGYEFTGWNRRSNGTGDHYQAGGTITSITSNFNLYATWAPEDTPPPPPTATNQPPVTTLTTPAHEQSIQANAEGVAPVTFTANVTDPDRDDVTLFIGYRKQNSDGSWPTTWTFSPNPELPWTYHTSPRSLSWNVELDPGTYQWHAQGFDRRGAYHIPNARIFSITPVPPPPPTANLGCLVEPVGGMAPLGIMVTPQPTGFPVNTQISYSYDFNWDENQFTPEIVGISGNGFHSYQVAGDYAIRVRAQAGTLTLFATCRVNVRNPLGGDGGETRP